MHLSPNFLLHRQKLRPPPIAPGLGGEADQPPQQKLAAPRLAADHRKAQEVEEPAPAKAGGSGLASPPFSPPPAARGWPAGACHDTGGRAARCRRVNL